MSAFQRVYPTRARRIAGVRRRAAPVYRRVAYARPAASMRRASAARAVSSRLRAVRRPRIIKGHGAYSMDHSSDMQSVQQVPYMHGTDQCFHIKHREYIGDIQSSTGFQIWGPGSSTGYPNDAGYRLNPQAAGTFPWLSGVAGSFEQYEFSGMAFEYVPTCGDALSSSDNALGTVIMSVNYNSADVIANNKQQMMEQMWSVSGKPSEHKLVPVECKASNNPINKLYTSGSLSTGYDPRLYDLGFLQVATQGMQQNNVTIGELWVTYDVKLYKPQTASNGISVGGISAHYYSNAPITPTNWQTAFTPNSSTIIKDYDNIGVTFSGNSLTIATAGTYLITMSVNSGAMNFGLFSGVTYSGVTPVDTFYDQSRAVAGATNINIQIGTYTFAAGGTITSTSPTGWVDNYYDLLIVANDVNLA